jgi:hypothetical protein
VDRLGDRHHPVRRGDRSYVHLARLGTTAGASGRHHRARWPTNRDEAALDLARDHRAPVLVQSTVREEAGTHTCLPPVPGVTILCFHADPNTTRGEARAIGAMAARYHWDSIILVTSPDHAWRSRWRVSRCFPGEIYVSTKTLPFWYWFRQIPYQWFASAKALTLERGC